MVELEVDGGYPMVLETGFYSFWLNSVNIS